MQFERVLGVLSLPEGPLSFPSTLTHSFSNMSFHNHLKAMTELYANSQYFRDGKDILRKC